MTREIKKNELAWRGRTLARLAAVQAIFQADQTGQSLLFVTDEFLHHRLHKDSLLDCEEEGDGSLKIDPNFFSHIVKHVAASSDEMIASLKSILPKNWPLHRIDPVIKALFLAAISEHECEKTPKPVLINEYMNIAHGFFPGNEPRIVNGVLDKLLAPHGQPSHEKQ